MEKDIKSLIINYYNSNEYKKLSSIYSKETFMQILGIDRLETAHSNFIAWILDSRRCSIAKDCVRSIMNIINNANAFEYEILKTNCIREKIIDNKCRLDILLEIETNKGLIPCIIENKIYSKENQNQTEKYYEWAKKEYKENKPCYVYLTPSRKDIPKCLEFKPLTYQELLTCIEKNIGLIKDQNQYFIIQDYLHSLSGSISRTNYLIENSKIKKQDNKNTRKETIAMTTEEKELLIKMYDANQELFIKMFEAIKDQPDITDDTRKLCDEYIKIANKRDNSKYIFGNNEPLSKARLVLKVIKTTNDEKKYKTFEDLQEDFPNVPGGPATVKKYKDANKDHYYCDSDDILKVGNEKVVVSHEWQLKTIEVFIKNCKKIGIEIKKYNE